MVAFVDLLRLDGFLFTNFWKGFTPEQHLKYSKIQQKLLFSLETGEQTNNEYDYTDTQDPRLQIHDKR